MLVAAGDRVDLELACMRRSTSSSSAAGDVLAPRPTARTRITDSSSGYARVDGTVIASDLDDLLDGVLDAPINLTQFGGEREARVWTNTTASGVAAGAFDCSGWTSNAGAPANGWVGLSVVTNGGWTNFTTDAACSAPNSLYCFED